MMDTEMGIMMNKINKFRVWDGKEFSYNPIIPFRKTTILLDFIFENNPDLIFNQFIGKKDINGCDMYEGDIVEYSEGVELGDFIVKTGVIKYCDGLLAYGMAGKPNEDVQNYFWEGVVKHVTVIGNIYENPELLG